MGEGSDAGQGEPGFGDMAGSDALPDMRDTLPTFDESYGDAGDAGEADGEADGSSGGSSGSESVADSGSSGGASGSAPNCMTVRAAAMPLTAPRIRAAALFFSPFCCACATS